MWPSLFCPPSPRLRRPEEATLGTLPSPRGQQEPRLRTTHKQGGQGLGLDIPAGQWGQAGDLRSWAPPTPMLGSLPRHTATGVGREVPQVLHKPCKNKKCLKGVCM